jgi:peptidoglycan DL-endopeptidase CwlO
MRMSKRLAGLVLLGLAAVALLAQPASADPSSLASKEAQAERVLEQIRSLDSSLSKAIEAYNLANIRLDEIEGDIDENRLRLAIAKQNLRRAHNRLAQRLVTIYVSGSSNSTLEVLLGARTLDEVLSGIETANRVSSQDADVLSEVRIFRTEARATAARLKRARARQARLVRERAAHKASIESQLGERRRLLSTIKDEIARIQAAERARQARLAAEARARAAAAEEAARQQSLVAGPVVAPVESTDTDSADADAVVGDTTAVPDTSAVPDTTEVVAAPPAQYGGVVGIAMGYLGTPYVYGGASPSGFDCSGFIMYVYAQVGVSLPHNAAAQYGYGSPVSQSQLQPGDLVFFDGLGHAGIYVGGGSFIHSPHTGDVVKISSMSGWYASTYVGARRL